MCERVINIQFSSVDQSCPTFCNPMHCSTPGLPVHHQLLELTQTHVHWVSDAIQPSHPLSSPSPPTLNLSQHQSLFQWVSSSHQVAKVLEFQLQHQSFQWIPRTDQISFRMDWLDLLTVQGTLKSLLQHHSSKPSILLLMLRYTHDQSHFLPNILHLELISRQLRTWKTHGWSQPKAKGCTVWPSCHSPLSGKTDDILEKGTEGRGF